ncbi:membrane protein [Gordonia phage DirtyBoi]|nr:membrane protein [Gordonia phage DirtyBoi]
MKRNVVAAAGAAVVWAGMLGGVGIAAAEEPCVMPVAGGVAPCPPPIVSTSGGGSIGGGANTDPVTMAGDGPSYSYEAPTWKPAPDPEPTPEPETPDE